MAVQHLAEASANNRFLDLDMFGIELLEARGLGEQLHGFLKSQACRLNPGRIKPINRCMQIICLVMIAFKPVDLLEGFRVGLVQSRKEGFFLAGCVALSAGTGRCSDQSSRLLKFPSDC